MKALEVIERIQENAKDHGPELRMLRTVEVGQWVRQGDIAIEAVSSMKNPGKLTKDRQLAPGSTRGSRHVVEGGVKVYAPSGNDPLEGPIIEAHARFTVSHPEHAHVSLPSGCYRIRYQRDLQAEERARVLD